MKLTTAGELLASYVRRLVLEQQEIVSNIASKQSELSGTIKIVSAEGFATSFIPKLAAEFQARHPAISVQCVTGSHSDIFREIRHGHSDLGMSFENRPDPDISTVVRFGCETKIIMRRGHKLAGKSVLNLIDLARYPIATSLGTTTRQIFEHRAAIEGVEFSIKFQSTNSASIFNYLSASDAVSFGIELTSREWLDQGHLVARPLDNPEPFRRNIYISVMADRTLPRRVETFIEFIHQELRLTLRNNQGWPSS
ncbi:MAG: hypothetical protein EOO23_09440 [Comamonadaceae bacterium]|nr:MAG: hypothetical protein EOO23_09440 [Comamonadaceae bacterium]